MSKQYCKLIMVTAQNNNKVYEMIYEGGPNFSVNFGRVEQGFQHTSYPLGKWESKKREKISKGYKDVTDLVTTQVVDTPQVGGGIGKIDDKKVAEFLTLMKKYTDNLVSTTYSVKADNVSQAQVDEAQKFIDYLSKLTTIDRQGNVWTQSVNEYLISLYTTIPRKMRNVKDHLLPSIKLDRILQQEQDNLDAISSQVGIIAKQSVKKTKIKGENLLDTLGISKMETSCARDYYADIGYLIKQIGGRTKLEAVFDVNKPSENKVYEEWLKKQKNKTTKILIHGTRNSSVLPILKSNLQIRPAGNFQFSGKVYGDGNYFSETVVKSLNYTGNDNDKVLLVYEVHTGNPFIYEGWYKGNAFTLNYSNLQQRGFDSTLVKAGGGLLNTEVIAYKEEQNRIKYVIWLKN